MTTRACVPERRDGANEDLREFIRRRTTPQTDEEQAPWCPNRNLLVEIAEILGKAGMDIDQIACVTNRDGSDNIDVTSFLETARRFEYDPGYGSEKVPADLVLMLTDGTWLERVTDDGAEWFEHKRPPKVTAKPRTVSNWNQTPYAAKNGVSAFFRG